MINKITSIASVVVAIAAMIFSSITTIRNNALEEKNAALESQYRHAVTMSEINNEMIGQLYAKYVAFQSRVDSLKTESVAITARIAASELRTKEIRKALEKPTRFQDSTKYSILKNLPE